MQLKSYLYSQTQVVLKGIKNRLDRLELKNEDFSIISNHCMGGFIYHDLGKQFLSPTINLRIVPPDFVEFLKHLNYYIGQEIIKDNEMKCNYPVGKIKKFDGTGYIHIYFVHYKSFDDAVKKWYSRAQRINWDNLIVMMTAREGCEYSVLHDFEQLPYDYKVCYTLKPYEELPHCKYARLDNGKDLRGYISDMINIWGKRAFECNGFDYVAFINKQNNINFD